MTAVTCLVPPAGLPRLDGMGTLTRDKTITHVMHHLYIGAIHVYEYKANQMPGFSSFHIELHTFIDLA